MIFLWLTEKGENFVVISQLMEISGSNPQVWFLEYVFLEYVEAIFEWFS